VTYPDPDRRPAAHNHFIVGLIILGVGCILLLDQVGILDAGRIFMFWPLLLIWFGYFKWTRAQSVTQRFWAFFLFLLGLSFQAEELGFGHIRFETIWPVLLICAGILMILKRYEARNQPEQMPPDANPPGPGPTIDVPPNPGVPPIDVPPSGSVGGPSVATPPYQGLPPAPGSNVAPLPPPPSSQTWPPPGPPPFQPSEPSAGSTATPPPNPTGTANSPFGFCPPPKAHANFGGGGPTGQGWSRGDKSWDDFHKDMHDFGRKMDEFGERMYGQWRGQRNYSQSNAPRLNEVNVFFGGKKKIVAKNFAGGDVVAIFGGYEIDLSEADMTGSPIEIEVVNIFGGGEIRVPPGWEVSLQTVGIFGGCGDRTWHPEPAPPGAKYPDGSPVPPPKRLIIKGVAIFGGMTVKN
jgi:predicted membrane protein